jgi:predicted DNA-binding ribbon-helix-helix protein
MKKKSVLIAGRHSTSISLEDEFFAELKNIASEQKISINQLITKIDSERTTSNLSSALRVYILDFYKSKLLTPK